MKAKKWFLGFMIVIVGVIIFGCASNPNAKEEESVYLESVDKQGNFTVMKLIDKETGCKYLVTREHNRSQMTVTQMRDSLDKPVCK